MASESTTRGGTPSLRQRRLMISTNLLIQVLAVVAILGMLNWLVARHYYRFDWTKTNYYALSDKTKQTLAALKSPVKIVVFLQPGGEREYLEKVYQDVRNLLKEFEFIGHGKVQVEYVDPQRDRARAEQLVTEYKVDTANVVIFACGSRHKYVTIDDMVEFDRSGMQMGGEESLRVKAFKGEGAFLSAIQTVTEEEPPKVYFLTGHGERDPEQFDQQHGYSSLASYIKRDNITVAKWNLQEKQALPTDAGAIVIAGPRTPFSPAELAMLQQYLQNNGRLFVMLDPREQSGLVKFLQPWGVQVDTNLILAKAGALLGTELVVVDALGTDYAHHPITAKLEDVNTDFPYARSVRRAEPSGPGAAEQTRVTELVKTPKNFWGETDLDAEQAHFDPTTDRPGPLSLAVAVETEKPSGVELDIPVTRMVVVGTASFVDNSTLTTAPGNLDFFMNALNWLLHRSQLVAIGPKVPEEFSLAMSIPQVHAVYALTIGGLPLAVAILGVVVWMRRRK